MGRITSLLPAVVAAPLVAALLAVPVHAEPAPPEHVPVWDNGPGGERYVALGDSFVSGPGILPQRPIGCSRSEKNFPTLVATDLAVTSFIDASCGGATTRHFTEPQTSGSYTNAPQLDALSEDTTLVTFGTMGGNDIGLVQLATSCASTACGPSDDPAVEQARDDLYAATGERLRAGIEAARLRAPRADVLVVGYGTYVTPGGCPAFFFNQVQPDEFDYIQGEIDRLSDLMERIAAEEGVPFIDQRDIPGAIDHTVCADLIPVDKQWIRGVVTEVNGVQDGAVFHPSTAGMRATADYVLTRIAEERAEPTEPTEPTDAERLAALKAKAGTVTAGSACVQRGRVVRVKVRGGQGAVSATVLRVGERRLARDTTAPYVLRAPAQKVRRSSGKVRVAVTLRDRELSHTRTLTVRRPRCAR